MIMESNFELITYRVTLIDRFEILHLLKFHVAQLNVTLTATSNVPMTIYFTHQQRQNDHDNDNVSK